MAAATPTVALPTAAEATVPCCPPLLSAPLSADDASAMAELLKVVADPIRLRLLSLVAAAPGREVCACDLVEILDRSQPTVSHHLKTLHEAGLLSRERRGNWIHYELRSEALTAITTLFAGAALPDA